MDKVKNWFTQLCRSIWLFPVMLTIPLIVLTSLQISGSSVGVLHSLFYGSSKDPGLIAGSPQAIRSDEWLVNTQTTVSQGRAGYPSVNPDIGAGENMSLNAGVPYKEWSEVFRPQNIGFFILPLAYAFAFQWWILGYLLIVSCYFFILALMPRKRLLAALLSLSLFFGAFVQWWYEYGTLASLYYSLFIATLVIHLTRQKQRTRKILLCVGLSYLLICFALLLYPPFQIACGLALAAFLLGYFWESYPELGKRKTLEIIAALAVSAFVAVSIVGVFIITRPSVLQALAHTSYPGQRTTPSGGFSPTHLLSSQLGYQFTSPIHAAQYHMDGVASNQSETSNFLLLSPLLVIPILALMYKDWRKDHHIDRLLLVLTVCFSIFILHLFVPAFTPIAKIFLLGEVPAARLLIGMGLLNILVIAALIRRAEREPKLYWFSTKPSALYALLLLALELGINLYIHSSSGLFVGAYRAIAFALPLPLIVYLLLRKQYVVAAALYLAFSFFISFKVNPLYRGLDIITKNQVSKTMVAISKGSTKRWITDSVVTENLAAANGLHSLAGVYYYPQKPLWSSIPNAKFSDYNRYAHVTFGFFADAATPPQLKLAAQDQLRVTTGICNSYLRQENVGFVLTSQKLTGSCIAQTTSVSLPAASFYVYRLY